MSARDKYRRGQIIKSQYPFYFDAEQWRPGAQRLEGNRFVAHGVGEMELRVEAVLKMPPPWQTRIAFTRTWIDPDGVRFRTPGLQIKAIGFFGAMSRGYRYWGRFDMEDHPGRP